jgi:hypothetical protein
MGFVYIYYSSLQSKTKLVSHMYNGHTERERERERERENLGNERKGVKDRDAIRQSLKELHLLSNLRLLSVSLRHGYAYCANASATAHWV